MSKQAIATTIIMNTITIIITSDIIITITTISTIPSRNILIFLSYCYYLKIIKLKIFYLIKNTILIHSNNRK